MSKKVTYVHPKSLKYIYEILFKSDKRFGRDCIIHRQSYFRIYNIDIDNKVCLH